MAAESSENVNTDWSLCVLCQENTTESLQCPSDSKRSDVGAGYQTLADNILEFHQLGCMPISIPISRLDDSDGIQSTFLRHKARWHKSCALKFNKTKLDRARDRARKRHAPPPDVSPDSKYTRSSASKNAAEDIVERCCFFCDLPSGSFHNVCTFGLDARVRRCALALQDQKLISKLSAGDLMAQEACYHSTCLALLYKRQGALDKKHSDDSYSHLEGIALAKLVAYIEERYASSDEVVVFKLADLANLYSTRMEQLGVHWTSRVHTTRLKERILSYLPDLETFKDGCNIFLSFKKDVGVALSNLYRENADDEAIHLTKTANIIRREMLQQKNTFHGVFEPKCQSESVPASLLSLVNMIFYGPSIETQSSALVKSQAGLTIAQLFQYHCFARRQEGKRKREHHIKARETPLPMHVGLTVHAKTRSRDLVDTLYSLGVCVSYDRVLAISTDLGNAVCQRYYEDNAVCPPSLREGLFTSSAVDNIDHNPSSTTARDSFHGTGISVFQHPTAQVPGVERTRATTSHLASASSKSVVDLPDTYSVVPPLVLPNKTPPVPVPRGVMQGDGKTATVAMSEEFKWLEAVNETVLKEGEKLSENKPISWSAYHSRLQPEESNDNEPAISALLPLFPDQAKSAAMIRHSMDVIKDCVNRVNPGQTPVIAMDQPLFTLAKQIQWNFPEKYGEDKFVIMFGGLHVEMAFLKALGGWLDGSGWTSALSEANVATPGTADSFLKAAMVTRTRRSHQVTASSLYILLIRAYDSYKKHEETGSVMSFDDWCLSKVAAVPQFQFWNLTLRLELLLLTFVRSLREANFQHYVDALTQIIPWFFALDHPNYARWLPVHLQDMCALQDDAGDVAEQFNQGTFVVRKSTRGFSRIPIDQAHEQNNAMVKGDGGAVGLTDNPSALRRWMVSGPEVARLVNEFETSMPTRSAAESGEKHHEDTPSLQSAFHKDVTSLVGTIEDMGNPFLEDSEDLFVLDNKDILGTDAVMKLRTVEEVGPKQYADFVAERLVDQSKSIYDPIKRNNLAVFTGARTKTTTKTSRQLTSAKNDCSLFSRLYISCQTREGNLDEFFEHENTPCPPSLSHNGMIRVPQKKSDLAGCLESLTTPQAEPPKDIDAIIIDGAVVVNMIRPGPTSRTFAEYANESFIPYILAQLSKAKRLDVVWDEYIADSLKATTRLNRGQGTRRRVRGTSQVPHNWQQFLRNDENKRELFHFLGQCLGELRCGKQLLTTVGHEILSVPPRDDVVSLSPCTHEEADTRMMLHSADAVQQGHRRVMIRTVDTDVLVLAIVLANRLQEQQAEIWVSLGAGSKTRYIAAHAIARYLGPEMSKTLHVFHAFTGCDTVSCFAGRGKKTAFATWKSYPAVTGAFMELAATPVSVSEECISHLERFVVLLYDRTSTKVCVNDARKQLFAQKGRAFDAIPPTKAALLEHTKRAAYQSGYCWGQMLVPSPHLPSPSQWGWIPKDGRWQPFWTALPEVIRSCRELLRCGCRKSNCRRNCSCAKAVLKCTALCSCSDTCCNRW